MFCEKPVAAGVDDTVRVLEAAKQSGTVVHDRLPAPLRRRLRRRERRCATASWARCTGCTCSPPTPTPPAAGYILTSGGIYRDCHIHDFDILRWVTGREAETVYATGSNRGEAFFAEAGDVDNSAALLTLDDGTLVTVQGSRYNGAGYDVRMELAGTLKTRWSVSTRARR